MSLTTALIDSGPLVAYYSSSDQWHGVIRKFFATYKGRLITAESVVTEVMWLLSGDWRVQNEFLDDIRRGIYQPEPLIETDYAYIKHLNEKYRNVPGDFADLSLVAISERLQILNVVSLDADFDIYRSYAKKAFKQLLKR